MDYSKLEYYLSEPRLNRFLVVCGGSALKAEKLYGINLRVAGAAYPLLNLFEIFLRNALTTQISIFFNDSDWIIHQQNGFMSNTGLSKSNYFIRKSVQQAQSIIQRKGGAVTAGNIVAEQSFGFWTSLFEPHHFRLIGGAPLKIKNVIDQIEKQVEGYKEFKEEVNSGEETVVMKYLVSHRLKKGSVREDGDYITNLIQDLIGRIKAVKENKPFIFILDDLDRLDPEHVFRLFNVFTAHHESKTDKNKFNFDQVIFVCDVRNIHYMFQHKYGAHTDFQGYIDKFYSSHIFVFDFKAYIKEDLINNIFYL